MDLFSYTSIVLSKTSIFKIPFMIFSFSLTEIHLHYEDSKLYFLIKWKEKNEKLKQKCGNRYYHRFVIAFLLPFTPLRITCEVKICLRIIMSLHSLKFGNTPFCNKCVPSTWYKYYFKNKTKMMDEIISNNNTRDRVVQGTALFSLSVQYLYV